MVVDSESSKDQYEVADQLGLQVRRAVQILIRAIHRIDHDRQLELLAGLGEETLYHAAVTVMMRLAFLLAAEEHNVLLLGNEFYDARHAVSTLRDQLQEVADKQGEEVLERRYVAWSRLLATFRAVHGGATHEDLRLPAYGGSLFDPDRFPFLEGRTASTSWKDAVSGGMTPLPIDDHTVLHLLRSLQLLEMKVGAGLYETRPLSFRALGIEAIGNVYEGLLDQTAKRAAGAHYTPPTLTEPIVKHTLDPLVYVGPAEGLSEDLWRLRSPREILQLKVCDLAMGSGAFLVQVCRYLSERLVEAWEEAEEHAGGKFIMTHDGELSEGDPSEPMLPTDLDERLTLARRYVADRCLYGVDKNPMAVEMAKLSLWLLMLQKDRPFTFIDHALKCGDSLLGLTSVEQIDHFHIHPALGKALGGQDARLIADVIIGAFISTATKGEKALEKRLEELGPLLADDVEQPGAERRADLKNRAAEMLNEGRGPKHPERTPFHWVLEFPEVFGERGGFDAFVGNPPFMGGAKISSTLGDAYLGYVLQLHEDAHGNGDIAAHFFRRAFDNLRPGGTLGLIATNTIAQGDTRTTGLKWICEHGGMIYRARRRKKWPGTVAVVVSVVHIIREKQYKNVLLDGRHVPQISAFLFAGSRHGNPAKLESNANKSFSGAKIYGQGFIFDDSDPEATPIAEMQRLLATNRKNAERIFSYIGGEELNSSPTQAHHRYVINFGDLAEDDVRRGFPQLLAIVEAKVKSERMKNNREGYRRYWWQFGEKRVELWSAIRRMNRVLVISLHSKDLSFVFLPSDMVFSHALGVFALDQHGAFVILQARLHETWARFLGSSLEDRLRYTPSDCFKTFPFPRDWEKNSTLEAIGKKYYEFRAALMIKNNEGLTKTYNRFHNPGERSAAIQKLRKLHAQMDRAVLDAYGWTDIQPVYDFRKQLDESIRYTWSEDTRDDVLGRLLELNHQRHAEEVAAGLHEKGKKAKAEKHAAKHRM